MAGVQWLCLMKGPQLFGSIFGWEANANSKGYLCSASDEERGGERGSLCSLFLCRFFTQSRQQQNVTAVLASAMKEKKSF